MFIEMRDGTGIKDGRYVANGICHNCKTWSSGSIDFDSKTQPMIYAVGPDELHLSTNALDAGLRRHDYYGSFTMDLQAAKGDLAHFPPTDLSNTNATVVGHEQNDHEYSSSLHAVAMAGTFVVVFPVGVFYQKVLRTVRWHWITQAFGVVVVLAGAGLGLGMSHYYNRSKHFNSAHQLIGIVVVLLVLLQASLGSVHHRIFKTKQQPTIMGVIHRFLGPVLICVGIINGILGFNLAIASHHNIGYAIIVLIVVVILFGAAFFQMRRRRRQEAFNTPAAQNFSNAYNNPSYTNDIPLQPSSGRPPAYERPLGA
ncbi:MAG: hypothetical protein LQ350_000011 [Teloschistes chrysophthalmus]|nr:MAG: hypothetical protein LQ350_000011 [Niorma chrysophthalma]